LGGSFLTPWSRFLLERLTGFQPSKILPAFHGTQRFTGGEGAKVDKCQAL